MTPERERKLYEEWLAKDTIKASWLFTLMWRYRGVENAIKRVPFMEKYCGYKEMTPKERISFDREFRHFYGVEIPVLSSTKHGIWWPGEPSDMTVTYNAFAKRNISLNTRWKRLRMDHPELMMPGQMELPLMMEERL